eukprot:gene13254-9097_t
MSSEDFFGLPVRSLRDVLRCVPLPDGFDAAAVSSKWRCVIAPKVKDETTLLAYLDAGVPAHWTETPPASIPKETGVQCLTGPAFDTFPKPQIAVKNGWGSPGTVRDHSTYHVLVKSFSNVFDPSTRPLLAADPEVVAAMDEEGMKKAEEDAPQKERSTLRAPMEDAVLELQLFHRDGVRLPEAANNALTWPDCLEHKVVCDVATVASQRAFQRWWDMNDCGEIVMEASLRCDPVALPPAAPQGDLVTSLFSTLTHSDGVSAASPAKLCIFGPRGSYDWFIHDDASLSNGSVVCLNIFETSDEELPKDASLLPVLIVCVVEGGGPALLMPPNLPTMHVMLQDAVTIEQRAISYLWLDDVSFFLHRCRLWSADPLIYPFVEEDLQDVEYMGTVMVPLLNELFQQCHGSLLADVVRRRLVASLYAVATQAAHYSLSESSRKSLLATVSTDNPDMSTILHAPLSFSPLVVRSGAVWSLREQLLWYWDTRQFWPKEGCVLRVPTFYPEGRPLGPSGEKLLYLPVVYPPATSSPVYGSEEESVEATLPEYLAMKKMESRGKELRAYLTTRKSAADDILDELF